MTYTVYILKCNDNSLYVGCTNNLEERMKEHNKSKKGAHYTKIRRPVTLMYTEEYETLKEARKREAEIKRWRRGRKLELIVGIKNKGTWTLFPGPFPPRVLYEKESNICYVGYASRQDDDYLLR